MCLVKAMVFLVVVCGFESWTIKKAEHRRIDAFELWCWRRLLRVPWTARRSNQSILKEINCKYSLEGLMLKLQYFGHLMRRADSLEKALMLGKIEGRRRRGWQRDDEMVRWHHWLNGHKFEQTPADGEAWHAAVHGVAKSQTWLSNWATEAWYAGKCPCKLITPWFSGLVNLLLNIAKGLWNGDIILDYPGRSSRIPWIFKSVEPFSVAIWERWYK